MGRIKINDNIIGAIIKMSDGNPGAVTVCSKMYNCGKTVDPDAAFGGMNGLFLLDAYNIYGASIWMLYKDVCGEHIGRTLALLRACQLGILDPSILKHAIANHGNGVAVQATCALVKERLPDFNVDVEE